MSGDYGELVKWKARADFLAKLAGVATLCYIGSNYNDDRIGDPLYEMDKLQEMAPFTIDVGNIGAAEAMAHAFDAVPDEGFAPDVMAEWRDTYRVLYDTLLEIDPGFCEGYDACGEGTVDQLARRVIDELAAVTAELNYNRDRIVTYRADFTILRNQLYDAQEAIRVTTEALGKVQKELREAKVQLEVERLRSGAYKRVGKQYHDAQHIVWRNKKATPTCMQEADDAWDGLSFFDDITKQLQSED